MSLVLLGTEGCHLCEQARSVLLRLSGYIPWDVELQDIAESEAMVALYGVRIPVLKYEASAGSGDTELDWPFNEQDVLNFIQSVRSSLSPDK